MFLFILHVQSQAGEAPRGVSVWADADDAAQAQALASARLADAGWTVLRVDSTTETTADDYFRTCPSQQAFLRAQAEGVAWRFDTE